MLAEYKIAVVPGSAYGKSTERFIRIGIGTESLERIEKAIILISREIESDNFDKKKINNFLKKQKIYS